ncbi:MAG: dienelactone hydrolase family protein [Burkholderiales bacterium]|nr:dienelactone hydrolase family protein [Burkholderiales bacterium]
MLDDKRKFDDPQMESLLPPVRVSRRDFLASSTAVAGYALSTGPVAAQTAIDTPADGLTAEDLKIPVPGGTMPGYLAAPEKKRKNATIVVVPEVFGMHRYQQDMCRRLAKLGYTAVTYDPFFRMGDLAKMTDFKQVIGNANRLEDAVMLADVDGLTAFLEKHPLVDMKRLGITGHCRGGRTVWMVMAHSKKFKTGVSWYGGLNSNPPAMPRTPHDVATALNGPVLGLYAGADAGIPTQDVARLQEVLKKGNKNSQASTFILYPNVPHAFHADYRATYRKPEAEAAWAEMLGWFKARGIA